MNKGYCMYRVGGSSPMCGEGTEEGEAFCAAHEVEVLVEQTLKGIAEAEAEGDELVVEMLRRDLKGYEGMKGAAK
jgi:hypothetical protein